MRPVAQLPFGFLTLLRQRFEIVCVFTHGHNIWDHEFNLVFTRDTGSHISMHMFWDHNDKVQKAAGIPHHRIHDLRDTFAVTTLQAGDDIKTVQENLGHADAAFTLNVYIASLDNMKKKSASNMQNLFDEASKGNNKGKTDTEPNTL